MESIEPQVKQEAQTVVAHTHSYSTRSKSKLNVIVKPRLKPVKFNWSDIHTGTKPPTQVLAKTVKNIDFYVSEDHPFNKRGFKYRACKPNSDFKSNLYSTTDLPPYKVRPSYFDRSAEIVADKGGSVVANSSMGWRSVRTNVGVREGTWYMEFNVINANNNEDKSHARLGVARKEASLEAPIGFDGYGYGIRDIGGQKITLARPKEFMKATDDIKQAGFTNGDVIGLLIQLPPLEEHRKYIDGIKEEQKPEIKLINANGNIVRDQIPIKYKNSLYYEQFEYTANDKMNHLLNPVKLFGEKAIMEQNKPTSIPVIPNSSITIYKNGVRVGTMFEELFSFLPDLQQQQNSNYRSTDDGTLGYYPMISVYQNGVVELNPGPEFRYPIQEAHRPLSDRYNEVIAEQWLWDLVDEVECEYLDDIENAARRDDAFT